jgi:hypothetical protein
MYWSRWNNRVTRAIAYPVMVLAAVGVLACFYLHFASFQSGPELEKRAISVLFPGIFVVWLPTVILMNRMTRDVKQRDVWKAALRGCPPGMKVALWAVIGYAAFAAFLLPLLRGSNPGASSSGFLIFPAVFYSVSFCVMYSALHVERFDEGRRCLNGHRISSLAKFCEECGAQAAPDYMQGHV